MIPRVAFRSVALILSIAAVATLQGHSETRAAGAQKTTGKIDFLTFFGSGGPRSGETIVASNDAPIGGCGYQPRFTARIGYPVSDVDLPHYLRMNAALLHAYVRGKPVVIEYQCSINLPEIIDVHP